MFNFGTRKINKQGGSYMIALPMQWMQDMGLSLDAVTIGMDEKKNLRIAPATPCKDVAGAATTQT